MNTEFISVNAIKGTDLSLKDGDQITVLPRSGRTAPRAETESIAFSHSAPGRKTGTSHHKKVELFRLQGGNSLDYAVPFYVDGGTILVSEPLPCDKKK